MMNFEYEKNLVRVDVRKIIFRDIEKYCLVPIYETKICNIDPSDLIEDYSWEESSGNPISEDQLDQMILLEKENLEPLLSMKETIECYKKNNETVNRFFKAML